MNIETFFLHIPEYLKNSSSLIVLVTDIEGIIRYVNDAYLKCFQFAAEDVIGKHYSTQIYTGDNERVIEAVKKCIDQPGAVVKTLIRKPQKNSNNFYFTEWEFSGIFDENNVPIGIISIGYSVNDSYVQGKAEREEFLNLINDMTAESWALFDTNLRLKTCNKKAIETVKNVFNVEPLPGDYALMFVEDCHREIMLNAFEGALNGETVQLELTDSRKQHYVITIKPVYKEDKSLLGIAHYCLDVTNLRRSHEQIRTLNLRYHTLINQLDGIVVIIDQTGKIHYVSDNLKKFSGFDTSDVLGVDFSKFVHPDDLQEMQMSLSRLKNLNDSVVVAFRSLNKDGNYNWTLGKGTVMEENGEKFILGVILNIDELKQKDEIIEQHHKRFQQIAWLQSHEVRAPLARLLGLTEAIYTDLIEDRDELKQFILYIKQAAQDLDAVIHKIVQMTELNKNES